MSDSSSHNGGDGPEGCTYLLRLVFIKMNERSRAFIVDPIARFTKTAPVF
ncbi:MAG: hypothetical protein AB8C02_05260 [Halioglobus sp.]